jgi:hypothetical protein
MSYHITAKKQTTNPSKKQMAQAGQKVLNSQYIIESKPPIAEVREWVGAQCQGINEDSKKIVFKH